MALAYRLVLVVSSFVRLSILGGSADINYRASLLNYNTFVPYLMSISIPPDFPSSYGSGFIIPLIYISSGVSGGISFLIGIVNLPSLIIHVIFGINFDTHVIILSGDDNNLS